MFCDLESHAGRLISCHYCRYDIISLYLAIEWQGGRLA